MLAEINKRTRITYLATLIDAGGSEPGTHVTLNPDTLEELDHGKKRVGHPRLNWYQVTLKDLWQAPQKEHPNASIRFARNIDIRKQEHVTAVEEYAKTVAEKSSK